MTESFSDKVARFQREIAERQAELHYLVLGDQSKCVTLTPDRNVDTADAKKRGDHVEHNQNEDDNQ